jgi:3-hydroxy acid dehydrogenase/malonic semialdehyde reductase
MSNKNIQDKWVIISGASSGFGAAAAKLFAGSGAKLLLGARREDRLKAVAEEATAAGSPAALYHTLDVSKKESVIEFAKWVSEQTPKIDFLINNAGGAVGLEPVVDGKDEDWETMMQINVLSVLRMCKAFIPTMMNNPGCMIINVGSIAGRLAYANGAAYCAAKAGELSITKALRQELNGTDIRVGTIDPGMAETEFSMVRFKGDAEKSAKVYDGVTPLRADDVAEAMLWVASRPPHVNIDEIVMKCTDQAEFFKTHRRTS